MLIKIASHYAADMKCRYTVEYIFKYLESKLFSLEAIIKLSFFF